MPRYAPWLVGLLVGLGMPMTAWADRVHLSNGRVVEGIIVEETASRMKVQMAWAGYIWIHPEQIVSIEPGTEVSHRELLARWETEYEGAQERERVREAFEQAQLAKGLVRYRGRWLTREEFVRIEDARALEEKLRLREDEARRAAERLEAVQRENQRLQQELTRERYRLRQPLIVPHPFRRHHRRHFVRDEQGNLLRSGKHDGHQFFISPDGRHIDLEPHGAHLAFVDEEGIHHDVQRVWH